MSITIEDKDLGWKKLQKDIAYLTQNEVVIGLFDNNGEPNPETNIAARGLVNEYGNSELNIPERPFMRQTMATYKTEFDNAQDKLVGKIIDGKLDAEKYYNIIGELVQNKIKYTITNGNFVANSLITIAKKGSDKPLIDTGEMRNSIEYKVRNRTNE